MSSSKKHKNASTSSSINFVLPNGPSTVCLRLQARIREGGGQSADQTLPFLPVKKEILLLCGIGGDGSSLSVLLQLSKSDTSSSLSFKELPSSSSSN